MKEYDNRIVGSIKNSINEKFGSRLVKDGIPSFYMPIDNMPCCTHRMSENDMPIWCANGEEVIKVMDLINELKTINKRLTDNSEEG